MLPAAIHLRSSQGSVFLTREPIISGQMPEDEDRDLRPQSMDEIIGQRKVFERIQIAVDAANKRGDVLGHILLDGPPGLGKDLVPYLTNADERSVLFIDEIHRLPTAVEEYLYTAMEDFRVDIVHGEGTNARTLNLWLKPFTLIGATTRAGLLSAPLRDRFQLREHLDFYSDEELASIVRRNAAILNVEIDATSCATIASRSRGTPRRQRRRLPA